MKRHITTSLLSVIVAAALIVPLSACGNRTESLTQGGGAVQEQPADGTNNTSSEQNQDQEQETNNVQTEPAQPEEPALVKEQISVFYTDDDMMELHEQKSDIEFADPKDKLKVMFTALQKDGAKGEASLWKHAELLSAKQDGAAVTLDLHLPDEARLGAPGEMLAIQALTRTYFQLQDVTSIDLLVDGEAVDSLMGHEEIDHPITKP
ncbi:GerMN domain-containing protein [Paenibacillus sp. CF384]|uniref:GerMN domain-containing protein n=1 Tax=Paenibacillus sp. CF384 TaxID=1884382 RepID=UPI000895A4B2|nr:GerMN domain-containing protein [Paenibacillus sp. CF384]SDW60124.1 Sporulation and spore germination [Paenibacillus sp. CF384]